MQDADGHAKGWVYQIAIGLIDEYGRDPDWVMMVMKAKGHGDMDLVTARRWVETNPQGCRCSVCRPPRPVEPPRKPTPVVPQQLDLFG